MECKWSLVLPQTKKYMSSPTKLSALGPEDGSFPTVDHEEKRINNHALRLIETYLHYNGRKKRIILYEGKHFSWQKTKGNGSYRDTEGGVQINHV